MKFHHVGIASFSLFLFITTCIAQEDTQYIQALTPAEINHAWFQPELSVNREPAICNALLAQSKKAFFSGIRDPYFNFGTLPGISYVDWSWPEPTEITLNSKSIYLSAGCSGPEREFGCSIRLTNSVPSTPEDFSNVPEEQTLNTSYNFKLAKDLKGRYWIYSAKFLENYSINSDWKTYSESNDAIEAFIAKDSYTWEKACGIALVPSKKVIEKAKGFDLTFTSLNQMKSTADEITGGSGGVRHGLYSAMYMDKILYRPWALSASPLDPGQINPAIQEWGYLGIYEFEKLAAYKSQLETTANIVAKFYSENFGWSKEKSFNMAHSAILGALNVDNKFGGYTGLFSQTEITFRKAILEHKPLDEIKAIPIDLNNAPTDIAVTYPEALRYLLDKGVDPNIQNDFGKTSLMYAVQYNQLDSVKILLAKGANPNLFTIINGEGLKRSGMTALHYAVRYASADIIKALLNAGAFPFARTSETENFYPIDWLHIYNSETSTEPNKNITKDQLSEIEERLKPLTAEEQTKKAFEYILLGEKEFQQNQNKHAAYNNFKFALALDPKNERALNDFALLSIAMEKWGEALEASQYIIDNTKNNLTKANAYYNYGLACQVFINQYGSAWTEYNGKSYCTQNILDPYLKSYQLRPMPIKAQKILSIFKENKIKACNFPTNDTPEYQLSFICEEGSALCVLSKKEKLLDTTATFSLQPSSVLGDDKNIVGRSYYFKFHPYFSKSYELGDFHLTVYNSQRNLQNGKFFTNGKICGNNGIQDINKIPSINNHLSDLDILNYAKEETDKLPREKISADPNAPHNLFFLSEYDGPIIKATQGDVYIQTPSNEYIRVIAGDRLLQGTVLYIKKGASFQSSDGYLDTDPQYDRILKVMTYDQFNTLYGNKTNDFKFNKREKILIKLNKL